MRTNPNIILSGNQMAAPQLPDVNAMTQTRTAGMENIYKIEQARAEQARVAQKEQAATEEKAMIEAVLPAYLFTIETGDAEGGFDLLPPQYQESFRPLVDQLAGKPPEQVRAAVYGSLVTSEAGRAALEAVQRAKNTEVQFGQLDVSRQRLAQDAAAANQPPQMTPYQAAQIEIEKQKLAAGANETRQKETAAEVKARLDSEKRVKDIDFAVKQVEAAAAENGLLDKATGSYLGNLVDTASQLVGYGTEGAIANARMKPIADLVLKLVPRFEGPQAIPDVQSYKEAAGDLANPNLPTSVKKAAAAEIVRLLKDYPGQFEYAGDGGAAAGGNVIDFNDLGD